MLKDLLKNYTDLKIEIKNDRARMALDTKEEALAEIENKIKEAGRKASADEIEKAKTEHFFIRVDQPFHKWYDWKAIKKHALRVELKIIEDEALTINVNTATLEKLVQDGKVSRELRTKKGVFNEEKLTARVVIVPIKKHG